MKSRLPRYGPVAVITYVLRLFLSRLGRLGRGRRRLQELRLVASVIVCKYQCIKEALGITVLLPLKAEWLGGGWPVGGAAGGACNYDW